MLNPQSTLNWLDDQLKLLTGKNAQISDEKYKRIFLRGIGPRDLENPHEHFWFLLFGQMKNISCDRSKLRAAIWDFWSNYQSDSIKATQAKATSSQAPVLPGAKPTGNLVENKFCTHCESHDRKKVMNSHNLSNCFFKDFTGTGFFLKTILRNSSQSALKQIWSSLNR